MIRSSRNVTWRSFSSSRKRQSCFGLGRKIFDEHVNRVSDLIEKLEKLEDLVATTEPVRPHASTDHREDASRSMRNQKWLRYLKSTLDKAKATIRL